MGAIYPRPGGSMKNLLIHDPDMQVITSEETERPGCKGDYHCFAMNSIMYDAEQHAKNIRKRPRRRRGVICSLRNLTGNSVWRIISVHMSPARKRVSG